MTGPEEKSAVTLTVQGGAVQLTAMRDGTFMLTLLAHGQTVWTQLTSLELKRFIEVGGIMLGIPGEKA